MIGRGLRRWLVVAVVVAALIGAYAALGFLLVPRLLRSNLQSFAQTHYGRPLSVGEIHFNPFTLALEAREVSFPDARGQPLLAFNRLFVNVSSASIWRRGPSFQEITLEGPFAHVLVNADGTLNLAELGKGFSSGESATSPQPAKPARVFIDRLSVRSGRVVYEDHTRPHTFVADLTPVDFELRDFSTTARTDNSYSLEGVTKAGEHFAWNGTIGVNPVASRGRFEIHHLLARTLWRYARDSLGFEIASGSIDLGGDYVLAAATNPVGLTVDVNDLAVKGLSLTPKGNGAHYIDVTRLEVQGTHLDLASHTVRIGKVALSGGGVKAWRNSNGSVNLAEFAGPATTHSASTGTQGIAPEPAKVKQTTQAAHATQFMHAAHATQDARDTQSAPPTQPAWSVSAPDISIDAFKVSAEDREVTPAAALILDPLNLHVTGFTTAPGALLHVEARSGVNHSGKLQASARFAPDSGALTGQAVVAGLDLKVLQPYIARQTSMTLLSGVLGSKLAFERSANGALDVTGDTEVTRLRTIDNALKRDFVKWNDLRVSGIDFHSMPAKLRIKRIDTRGLYARVIIAQNQMVNITEVLTPPGDHAGANHSTSNHGAPSASTVSVADIKAPPANANRTGSRTGSRTRDEHRATDANEASSTAGASADAMPVSIGLVRIADGSAHFADYSIQPNYAVAIQSLNGSIAGLSSDPSTRAKLDLQGKVDRYAPVKIDGEINLLSASAYSDVRMSFKGVELSSVTPYSGRFAGYKIDKGKLSADLSYHIDHRKLTADHNIVIDQLQLGEKVESPEATKLPLRLAVALLKDRNGVINLGLPVSGSLDDPQFKLGPIIWKVFVNLVTKAATAPFALLGRLFGGGDQMNVIDFQPGSATLEPAAQQRLASLVKALKERPKLELDVPRVFSAELDAPALARRTLDRKLALLEPQKASARSNTAARAAKAAGVTTGAPVRVNRKTPDSGAAESKTVATAPDAQAAAAEEASVSFADPAEHFRLLLAEYRAELGKGAPVPDSAAALDPKKKKKDPEQTPDFAAAITDLETALLARIQITDSDLEALGRRRARAMQDTLLGSGEIDPSRIFLINAPPGSHAQASAGTADGAAGAQGKSAQATAAADAAGAGGTPGATVRAELSLK